jgi:hypothetical protein
VDVFFEKAAARKDWVQGLSLRVKKQKFRVRQRKSETQVKLELQMGGQRGVRLLMAEAQPEKGLSRGREVEMAIPVPLQKALRSVLLSMIPC